MRAFCFVFAFFLYLLLFVLHRHSESSEESLYFAPAIICSFSRATRRLLDRVNITRPIPRTNPSSAVPPEALPSPPGYRTPQLHISRRTPSSAPSAEPAKHAVETPHACAAAHCEYPESPSTA